MASLRLGKEALIDAAIALMAKHDADAVSLRDINLASGHRNRSAATYHFGTKDELVGEMLRQVISGHDGRRVEMLDALEAATGKPSIRQVLEAAVSPLTEELESPEGRRRLAMLGNIISNERYMAHTQGLMASLPGLGRSTARLIEHVSWLPEPLISERVVLTTAFGIRAFADQARLVDAERPARPPLDRAAFTEHLVDLLEAMIEAKRPR